MENIKNGVAAVGDKISEMTSATSKEANKEVAKDNNADVTTRLSAGKDAVGDKVDEKKHNVSAETNKEAAKH